MKIHLTGFWGFGAFSRGGFGIFLPPSCCTLCAAKIRDEALKPQSSVPFLDAKENLKFSARALMSS